jgi:hypothetical protein
VTRSRHGQYSTSDACTTASHALRYGIFSLQVLNGVAASGYAMCCQYARHAHAVLHSTTAGEAYAVVLGITASWCSKLTSSAGVHSSGLCCWSMRVYFASVLLSTVCVDTRACASNQAAPVLLGLIVAVPQLSQNVLPPIRCHCCLSTVCWVDGVWASSPSFSLVTACRNTRNQRIHHSVPTTADFWLLL